MIVLHGRSEKRAQVKFPEIASGRIARFKKHGVAPTDFVIKHTEKRWGSCTPKRKIILNAELMKAPKGCIEYVAVHELCPLIDLLLLIQILQIRHYHLFPLLQFF